MIHSMEIELLVVEHCANDRAASELLRTALAGLGMRSDAFHTTVIADEEQAHRRGFTGSPTFLIGSCEYASALTRSPGAVRLEGTCCGAAEMSTPAMH